jgi:hypothetical protein
MPVSRQSLKDLWRSAANPAWLCFAWFGMTAGISLLEAPVKFTAPTITREIALDVGRVVFAALNQAELIALILLLILTRISGGAKHLWIGIGQLIVAGLDPGPSMAHGTYAVLELLKLLLLLFLGFRAMPKAATA